MAASPASQCASLSEVNEEERDESTKEVERSYERYRELISTLPKEKGWISADMRLYEGFWYESVFGMEGIMFAQEHFRARPSDVFLITTPKSGTTWLEALIFAIMNRSCFTNASHPLLTTSPRNCVPFLEFKLFKEPPVADIENLPSPRLFATHIPHTSLPKSILRSNSKIVYVCRDPKDALISLWYHISKIRSKDLAPLSLAEAFELFSKGISGYGPFWDHVLGYWNATLECPQNIFFLKYEELKNETLINVRRLADFLGHPFSMEEERKQVVDEIIKLCSFDTLSNLEVVVETWAGRRVQDFTLYSGALGTAFLLFKSYQLNNNTEDLTLCSAIVKACDSASSHSKDVTFICGRGSVCALGAVAAKHAGDNKLLSYYLAKFKEIKLPKDLPDELLYGRAEFLYACLFLNKHIGEGTIPVNSIVKGAVVNEIFKGGRVLGTRERCPLMFEWHGEKYWGAAHGLAGIMHVLMHVKLSPSEAEEVKHTLKYMIKYRFPSGNYPSSEQDRKRDCLVHWCHGAPGVALTLVKAAEVFGDKEFLEAAVNAAEVVWNRGLLKRVGLCHGVSGNTYVFLSLYRLTGNSEFLYRAKAFAGFLLDRAHKLISEGDMHGGDHPYSLFEGIGGMAYLFLDMTAPNDARFPGYEL